VPGNATRWYATREQVKAAVGIAGADLDALIDQYIESASADTEKLLASRRFIPYIATHVYVVQRCEAPSQPNVLYVEDLLSVTSIKIDEDADGLFSDETGLAATDYELLPRNAPSMGTPYNAIELTSYGTKAFARGSRVQVIGTHGYAQDTEAAGALAEADDGVELALNVTDSSLIGVGDTILIGAEQMFVSAKALLDTTATLNGALAANKATTTVAVNTGTLIKPGEVITVDSERMLIESISGNNLTVQRAYDGTVLASHLTATAVFAPRTLTVVRPVNGTAAATHADATAISRYAPPADIVEYVRASAIAHHQQGKSGWTGVIGGEEGAVETRMFGLWSMREKLRVKYGKVAA